MSGLDAFTWILLGLFIVTLLALRSIWASSGHARRVKLIWSIVVLVPVLGPLAWFVLGRSRKRR